MPPSESGSDEYETDEEKQIDHKNKSTPTDSDKQFDKLAKKIENI